MSEPLKIDGRLTSRQRNFVLHYLDPANLGNAMKCAELAGYRSRGGALRVEGCRLLHNPLVRAEIDRIASMDPLLGSVIDRRRWLAAFARGDIHPDSEPRDKLNALIALKKSTGDFVTKVEVTHHVETQPIDFTLFSEEQLRDYIAHTRAAVAILETVQAAAEPAALPAGPVIDAEYSEAS